MIEVYLLFCFLIFVKIFMLSTRVYFIFIFMRVDFLWVVGFILRIGFVKIKCLFFGLLKILDVFKMDIRFFL